MTDATLKALELNEPCAVCKAPSSRECKCGTQLCENCACPMAVNDGEKTLWKMEG